MELWGGVKNVLVYGGDRWFVYVLLLIFMVVLPFRKMLHRGESVMLSLALLICIYYMNFLPSVFLLNKVFYYVFFFIIGYYVRNYYGQIKEWLLRYWMLVYALAIILNVLFVVELRNFSIVYRFILPIIGTCASFLLAFHIESYLNGNNMIVRYVKWCGKYSLQIYLMSFAFPIIRYVIINVLHIENPFVIVSSVFVLQLICITLIVEVTKRIKGVRYLFGF